MNISEGDVVIYSVFGKPLFEARVVTTKCGVSGAPWAHVRVIKTLSASYTGDYGGMRWCHCYLLKQVPPLIQLAEASE